MVPQCVYVLFREADSFGDGAWEDISPWRAQPGDRNCLQDGVWRLGRRGHYLGVDVGVWTKKHALSRIFEYTTPYSQDA